jgi:hypothetical protein
MSLLHDHILNFDLCLIDSSRHNLNHLVVKITLIVHKALFVLSALIFSLNDGPLILVTQLLSHSSLHDIHVVLNCSQLTASQIEFIDDLVAPLAKFGSDQLIHLT